MKKIILFLFEGVELLEVGSFTDVFGWNDIVGTKDIVLETVSYKEAIRFSWGGEIKVDKVINESNLSEFYEYDALVVPGGFGKYNFFRDKDNQFFNKLVENFFTNSKYIVGACSGVINLLDTNHIKNVEVTTYLLDNKRYFNQLKNYEVFPVEKKICIDKNIFSCSGAGNAIELALKLLKTLTDEKNMENISKNMFLK